MRALLLLVLLAAACADNQSRCEGSVEQINDEREACGLPPVSVQASCFGFSELNESNCAAYFACDANRYSCEDGQLLQSTETCPPCE